MSALHEFTTVACPYDEVAHRLQAYLDGSDATIALRVPIYDLSLECDVEVRLAPKPAYPGYKILAVSWSPKDGGPYPSFRGTLSIADEGARRSRVELDGTYEPPFGVLGMIFDAAVGHRIAQATAAELIAQLKRVLIAAPV